MRVTGVSCLPHSHLLSGGRGDLLHLSRRCSVNQRAPEASADEVPVRANR